MQVDDYELYSIEHIGFYDLVNAPQQLNSHSQYSFYNHEHTKHYVNKEVMFQFVSFNSKEAPNLLTSCHSLFLLLILLILEFIL